MSQDQAKTCIEKMKTDEAFRAKVLAVEDVAARLQLINAEGFACSAEEIEAVLAELSDVDLDRVAGGVHWAQKTHCGTDCAQKGRVRSW